MSKKIAIIEFVALSLLGAFILFYATNAFACSLVLNIVYGFGDAQMIIASLPLFMVGLAFALAAMFILKLQKYPNAKKQLVKQYSLVLAIYGLIGLITTILTGTVVYGSFVSKYPFPGYIIICLIANIILLVGGCLVRFYFANNLADDTEPNKVKVGVVFRALGLGFVTFFSLERLGAIMWAIEYGQARSFYITWIFYLYMLVPMANLVYLALKYFGKGPKECKFTRIYIMTVIGVHFVFGGLCFFLGATNTLFVSAVSNAMGLERLASMPVVILLMFLGYTAFFIIQIVKGIKYKKAE